MSIILDEQLREQIPHDCIAFPISYFRNELATTINRTSPLHWHPDFEIATAVNGILDFQVGREHIELEAGDSIFINKNILHRIKQLSGSTPDPMPNIVFSGTVIATDSSEIYKKYIYPIECCNTLPFIVFKHNNNRHIAVNDSVKNIYHQMQERGLCYEMNVQRELNSIFEYIFLNFEYLPKSETTRININAQIRLQKMLSYIYEHYDEIVTLKDIADAANVSCSEAGRCFNAYMGCSPVDALIQYRLQIARRMLGNETLTLQEICNCCGFHSVNYFSRRFKQIYGYTPGQARVLGK